MCLDGKNRTERECTQISSLHLFRSLSFFRPCLLFHSLLPVPLYCAHRSIGTLSPSLPPYLPPSLPLLPPLSLCPPNPSLLPSPLLSSLNFLLLHVSSCLRIFRAALCTPSASLPFTPPLCRLPHLSAVYPTSLPWTPTLPASSSKAPRCPRAYTPTRLNLALEVLERVHLRVVPELYLLLIPTTNTRQIRRATARLRLARPLPCAGHKRVQSAGSAGSKARNLCAPDDLQSTSCSAA